MKTVLTLYSQPFPESMKKRSEDFYLFAREGSLTMCRGFVHDYDFEKKLFKKALFFGEKNEWEWRNDIKPDAVYDRSIFHLSDKIRKTREVIAQNHSFVNDLGMAEMMANKWMTYVAFKDHCPKTVLVKRKTDMDKVEQLKTKRVILKPQSGSQGKGIEIQKKEDFSPIKFPFIVQEVIAIEEDGNNLMGGPHDLRVVMSNDKPFHTFLRIPPKGKLISNLSQGGKIKLMSIEQLPPQLTKVLKEISDKLKKYGPRLCSIDFMIDDDQKVWLIEMNARPGIILDEEELPVRESYYQELVSFFLKI